MTEHFVLFRFSLLLLCILRIRVSMNKRGLLFDFRFFLFFHLSDASVVDIFYLKSFVCVHYIAFVRIFEDVPLVEFIYHVFTRMPGEMYRRRLRSLLLYFCHLLRALINSLVC